MLSRPYQSTLPSEVDSGDVDQLHIIFHSIQVLPNAKDGFLVQPTVSNEDDHDHWGDQ